uniref:calcium-transporting ATPase 10, plasma membrane-type-like isoform X3 n=1 Tax=Fragaria vesca subsp. vesca TaxID=101020 RepID=UPI0005CAF797|nr:PREDICTED: calcium-transporting ATPase 10, plasma membrane-type-like isoform X3 [Fragaria vesca subsp. vesca]
MTRHFSCNLWERSLTNFLDLPRFIQKSCSPRMSHSSGLPYKTSNDDLEIGLKEVTPVERISRWVQVKLYLKALYRFRHTLVLKKAEEKKKAAGAARKLRAYTQALRAAAVFKEKVADPVRAGTGDYFPIEQVDLARMMMNSDFDALQQYGGKEGLADLLKTDLDKGIGQDDLIKRRDKFGANRYPPKSAMSHWTCLWEALYDFTRILLVIAFAGSVVMGVLEETKMLGWHNVISVAIATAMFILIAVLSDYTQARLQHMIIRKQEMRNKKLTVIRAGRQVEVSICDIVVGDVVPLNIGDEVPADGIFIHGHSLAIDKFRVTGESKIFPKDSRKPFLRSGWKVAHGSATMLVIVVGKSTESGILRASTDSKNTENKTHLQVLLKVVATFMGAAGFMVAAIVANVVLFRDFFNGENSNGSPKPGSTLEEVIRISIIAVAIFVVALPQVLPLAFNISRLSSMIKMKADNALVRRPAVCETMALCNDVVCDKTVITLNQDNCQPEIKESVVVLQRAGIKVRLVTHDNLQTAKAIAMECGILASDGSDASEINFIEGEVFRQLSDSQREQLAEKILVMARSSPNDKLLLVRALRKREKIVAVTGYVSNDAHALHEADIGIAMSVQGTEVVKESSDIIILDDNFTTIAKSFKWGRSMHERVLRVMQQQLTANIVAATVNCLAAVYYRQIPLNAVQFVWVNVVIFCLGPLVLANESPADHLMNVPPIDQGQPLRKYIRWKRLLIQVVYQIIALLVINFQGGSLLKNYTRDHATKVKNTMIFNTFVVCQISIEFGVRKTGIVDHPLKWITANSVFLGIVGIILVIQFIIIEFLGKVFFIVRLNRKEWQFSLTVGIVELLFALLIFLKYMTQRNHH